MINHQWEIEIIENIDDVAKSYILFLSLRRARIQMYSMKKGLFKICDEEPFPAFSSQIFEFTILKRFGFNEYLCP